METCVEIEKIREETRLRRIREDDEKNNDNELDIVKENVINGVNDENEEDSNEKNEKNNTSVSDATGESTE